jgi:hypothetical protein
MEPASTGHGWRCGGVTIFGVQDDRILWGRLFMDEVDRSGEGIDQAVREITTGAE